MKEKSTWKTRVLTHWSMINRLAGQRFSGSLAEEAALYVLDRLEEDDWCRVRKYRGQARFRSFLAALTLRLLEDFSRHRFGRRRPPSWITALGWEWQRMFVLLCLQRLSVTEAVAAFGSRTDRMEDDRLEAMAERIREEVVDCGVHQGLEVELDAAGEEVAAGAGSKGGPEADLACRERAVFLELLFEGRLTEPEEDFPFLEKLRSSMRLSSEERLLLILCFREGMAVTRAGRMVGLNANQVHGRLRRLLSRLRQDFEAAGISEEMRLLLGA